MRTSIALALAALLAAPVAAGAEGVAIAAAAAISPGIDDAQVANVRAQFEEALRQTGIDVGTRGAEFVASLSLGRAGDELVLTAQVSRLRLDSWAARAEARVQQDTPEALAAAVQDLAGQIILAVRTAPARSSAQPTTRPPARKLVRVQPAPAPVAPGQDTPAE